MSPKVALKSAEAVSRRCSVKKVFLEILQNSQENTCGKDSFLIKLQTSPCNFIKKETLAQVLFSCEFCEISKSTFFIEHLLTTASDFYIFHRPPPPPLPSPPKKMTLEENHILKEMFISELSDIIIIIILICQNLWAYRAGTTKN